MANSPAACSISTGRLSTHLAHWFTPSNNLRLSTNLVGLPNLQARVPWLLERALPVRTRSGRSAARFCGD